jgi:ELWxxDGT repeat protein
MATGTSIAYFFGYDQGLGTNSIWKSDGTVAGTVHILDVQAPSNLIVSGTVAYFRALDPVNGLQPWKSDGTPGGTLMVKAIGTSSSSPRNFMAIGPLVFFAATTGTENLWQTDGTAAGTVMVQPSPAQPAPNWITDTNGMGVFGSELYFKAADNLYPWELWKTDGTVAGTVRVVISPPNLNPNGMTPFGSSVFFAGTDAAHGTELWSSDGTAAGTQLVWDLNPGPASSIANQFTVVESSLFFTANGGSGISLWKYPP